MVTTLVSPQRLARLLSGTTPTRPAYRWLAEGVTRLVLDGRVPAGTRLPPEREAAAALGLSRTTVAAAYQELRDAGYAVSRQGAGTWVQLPAGAVPRPATWVPPGNGVDLARAALPAPGGGLVERAYATALTRLSGQLDGVGYHPLGLPRLREVIAQHYRDRGLPTRPEEVLVTNGAQHALDLITRAYVRPLDTCLVETPTYPGALDILDRAGARMVAVGVDPWDVGEFAAAIRQAVPRLCYLVPDFHNPTGHVIPAADRAALLRAARGVDTYLVVDETTAGVVLDGRTPEPPFASFDTAGRVISIGSMSKTHWAGLRVGWIRAAAPVISRLAALRAGTDMGGPPLEQLAAVELLAAGPGPVADRAPLLRANRDALLAAVAQHLPEWSCRVPDGGLSAWFHLDAPISTSLTRAASRHGLHLVPGPRFGIDGSLERFLRIPFVLPADAYDDVIRRLATARAELAGGLPLPVIPAAEVVA